MANTFNFVIKNGATLGSSSNLLFSSRSQITSPVDGAVLLQNNAGTGFTTLQFGGTTSSFPSIRPSSNTLVLRLADDSGYAALFGGAATFAGVLTGTDVVSGTGNVFKWTSRSVMQSPVDGNITLTNNAINSFGLLQLGGTTTSFPAIKRNGTGIDFRLGDDSTYTAITASNVSATSDLIAGSGGSGGSVKWGSRSLIQSPTDGNITVFNNTGTSFGLLQLGGTTSSFPALKRSGAEMLIRLADDSGYATLRAGVIALSNLGGFTPIADGTFGYVNNAGTNGFTITGPSSTTAPVFQLGSADAASPIAQTIAVQSVVTGTTNTAGANLQIRGSAGTGTGNGGSIIFQVAPAGSTGTTQNSWSNALVIDSTKLATFAGSIAAGASSSFFWTGRSGLYTLADGNIVLSNNAASSFGLLQFGGTTSSFPALKRSNAELQARLADDSGYAGMWASYLKINGNGVLNTAADGVLQWANSAQTSTVALTAVSNNTFQLGLADSATPVAQKLQAQNVATGTADTAAPNFTISAPAGTGTGAGGSLIFRVAPAGSTGSTQNAQQNALTIASTQIATFGSSVVTNGTITLNSGNVILSAGGVYPAATGAVQWSGRSTLTSPADSNILLQNNAQNAFNLLQLGGTTSSFPAIKRNSAAIDFRLADDSGYADLNARVLTASINVVAGVSSQFIWNGSTHMGAHIDGGLHIVNNAGTVGFYLSAPSSNNIKFGDVDKAAPDAQTLSVCNVVAGTSNTNGANLTIKGSASTGTGTGGSIIFQVTPAGSTGTAQNAFSTALTIDSTLLATFAGSILVSGSVQCNSHNDTQGFTRLSFTPGAGSGSKMSLDAAGTITMYNNNAGTNSFTITPGASSLATFSGGLTLANTLTAPGSSSTFGALLTNTVETTTVSATAATGTINYDVGTQSVLYYTTNASANWTTNVRFNSGTSLNTAMATGQTTTIAFMVTQGATPYYMSAFQIDGNAVTPKWQGGTAPTAGDASSIDVYTFTITKTASATFTVLASLTKFA